MTNKYWKDRGGGEKEMETDMVDGEKETEICNLTEEGKRNRDARRRKGDTERVKDKDARTRVKDVLGKEGNKLDAREGGKDLEKERKKSSCRERRRKRNRDNRGREKHRCQRVKKRQERGRKSIEIHMYAAKTVQCAVVSIVTSPKQITVHGKITAAMDYTPCVCSSQGNWHPG